MYYKVLRMVDSEFYSAVDNQYAIKYEIGKTVFPTITGSKLFVFNTLRDALYWVGNSDCFIFKVECDNVQMLEEMVEVCWNLPAIDLKIFWDNQVNLEEYEDAIAETPDGTVGCDSLRLVDITHVPHCAVSTLLETLREKMKDN